jgi:peptide/nickel transport system ATP-binding protein
MSLLEIENLRLDIGDTPILKDIDLTIEQGEVMGLVGESGSGKSMTALTVMQLLPEAARAQGRVTFDGIDILSAPEAAMNKLRGDDIGMVFQEPMTALNPLKTIGEQVAEGMRWHLGASRADAEASARQMLARVGLADIPPGRYPHQLSGGQRQRVVIAIACALKPRLLIADEPSSALDVVVQARILELLHDLVREHRMGLLLVTHDLAVVAKMADRIAVMRQGKVVDTGASPGTLRESRHPYTRQLVTASMHAPPRPPLPQAARAGPLLAVEELSRDYPGPRGRVTRAVDRVSFELDEGRCVALVGRSGCGKSTLARMILALDRPSAGRIRFLGREITALAEKELRPLRRQMQVVFQDPYGSFDPRLKVERLVTEPLHLADPKPSREQRRQMAAAALAEVGLHAGDLDKYPHEFSGGQRQHHPAEAGGLRRAGVGAGCLDPGACARPARRSQSPAGHRLSVHHARSCRRPRRRRRDHGHAGWAYRRTRRDPRSARKPGHGSGAGTGARHPGSRQAPRGMLRVGAPRQSADFGAGFHFIRGRTTLPPMDQGGIRRIDGTIRIPASA